ncbi:DUF5330 domain-containing protein [Parvibaculum sp.]|uniref:DUF5330 domain-containing protein n=1 Tax=Parvibaculum sp. TaxID=2024848 RepID=UPI002730B697|nr:DUF5330 domain-containing protein [Parvibaculum sp.]MDP1627471.1 DUF5330 domain-containing protein [Parvibaculum sp.]MDP2148650.1 DUF5330 domain-containing protein [Parvibaculum sp.]MDP3326676.1 DUF5330 domain-containing protein [Parvibaculum sp.]
MSFILRAAFWLTVMAFLLPAAGYDSAPQAAGMAGFANAAYVEGRPSAESDIGATEALTLAARSAQDVMGFCGRNPDICEKSHAVIGHVLRQTVHYGGQALVWLTDKAREQQQDSGEAAGHQAAIRPDAPSFSMTGA